mmetsp:Transcript_42760/g.81613  ORF Transcript_42760/g.81613 Transcript_42760/m.81613 type:complete len:148 (+) Transcript_42760:703-1146(+)
MCHADQHAGICSVIQCFHSVSNNSVPSGDFVSVIYNGAGRAAQRSVCRSICSACVLGFSEQPASVPDICASDGVGVPLCGGGVECANLCPRILHIPFYPYVAQSTLQLPTPTTSSSFLTRTVCNTSSELITQAPNAIHIHQQNVGAP